MDQCQWPEDDEPKWELRHGMRHGVYRIYWKCGGSSVASVGFDKTGWNWFAPANWCGGVPCFDWSKVRKEKLLATQDSNRA